MGKNSILIVFIVLGIYLPGVSGISCVEANGDEVPDDEQVSEYDTLYSYTNPVGGITQIGDPFVMKHEDKYYLYPTTNITPGFTVWESENLVDWTDRGLAFDRRIHGNEWGTESFWAPEVVHHEDWFYMTYSARKEDGTLKIRIARSSSPLGPFVNYSEPFLDDDEFSYIDGHILFEGDEIYMYYVKDCSHNVINGDHVSQIYVVKLNVDLTEFDGEPELCIQPDQAWESPNANYQWNEGPFVLKEDGTYYMFYSANFYSSRNYSIGYATADNPYGPWTKYSGNPILKKDESLKVSGPGHCSITLSPDSTEYFMVYHTHTDYENPSGNRNVCIDRLQFDEEEVVNVIGPTRTKQELPSGVEYRLLKK